MKKIKISNFTSADIVAVLPSSNIEIKVGENIIVESDEKYLCLRYKNKSNSLRMSEFPATMFKNRWVISLIYCLNFDCSIDLDSVGTDIVLSERYFAFRDEILFSCLLVNSEFASDYVYRNKKDKRISLMFMLAISLLYIVLSLLLTVAVGSLILEDFNIAYILVFIMVICLMVGSVNHLINSLKFFNIGSNFGRIRQQSRMIEILKCNKFFVKYCNSEKED